MGLCNNFYLKCVRWKREKGGIDFNSNSNADSDSTRESESELELESPKSLALSYANAIAVAFTATSVYLVYKLNYACKLCMHSSVNSQERCSLCLLQDCAADAAAANWR